MLEEALLVSEKQNPNVEQYTNVSAAIHNAIECYNVIYDEKKKKQNLVSRRYWIVFSRGWMELSPARSQTLCHQCRHE